MIPSARPAVPPRRLSRSLKLLGFAVSAAVGAAGGLLFVSASDMPDLEELGHYSASPATRLFDAGAPPDLIAQLSVEQRPFVPIARMPRVLLDATVAVEDERFYSHWGLDLWGIARATLVNLIRRRTVQGGSTITQQLARTLFLTSERTLQRKIKEALLAVQIERRYKKEEILEMYLNQVYFGHGAYGAEQAARAYFGKHVEELTLPESALLAGLPRAPSQYSPRTDPEKARTRRNTVLEKMADNGFVRRAEAAEAASTPVRLRETEITNAPYFAAHVRQHLEAAYGNQAVYHGGLSVYTTLNLRLQTIAQRALEQGLAAAEGLVRQSRREGGDEAALRLQGALVALDPRTGAILAMIGGRNFRQNEFNRATSMRRQPGSSFKPYIYATALLNGFTPADLIDDSPQQFPGKDGKPWQPSNFERKFFGPTSLRRALTFSRNVVTVKLLNKLGIDPVVAEARKFGFKGQFRNDLTLALGTCEVGLLEMVSGFSVFANGGARAEPFAVKLVKDSRGNILEQHVPQIGPVLPPATAYLMLSMLQDTINYGTAKVVRRLGFARPAAGKTGSTNDFTDAWFVGFTPSLACGVWIGFDDPRTMGKNMTGGLIAAPIWAGFMAEALEHAPPEDFQRPAGIVEVAIDPSTGLLAGKECKRVMNEVFAEGTAPTRPCEGHGSKLSWQEADAGQMEGLHGREPGGTAWTAAGGGARPVPEPEDTEGQEKGF